jgi:hypothetical protein
MTVCREVNVPFGALYLSDPIRKTFQTSAKRLSCAGVIFEKSDILSIEDRLEKERSESCTFPLLKSTKS